MSIPSPPAPSPGGRQAVHVPQKGNALAIAGFVLALVGAVTGLIPSCSCRR